MKCEACGKVVAEAWHLGQRHLFDVMHEPQVFRLQRGNTFFYAYPATVYRMHECKGEVRPIRSIPVNKEQEGDQNGV